MTRHLEHAARALEVSNVGGLRTAPAGLRHFYENPSRNTSSRNGFVLNPEKSIEIDYDLLMTNVENMLIADKARLMKTGMKPKDLMVKSNPGLFGNMHQDITNPRDMYNFLSKRKFPKIADDDLSFNRQKTMFDDRLTRSNSFKDLDKSSNAKIQKKYHFHSHQDLSLIEKKDPSVVALNSNAPYVGLEDMAKLPEREKSMMTNFNLPSLRPGGTDTGKEANGGPNNSVSLPFIRSAPTDVANSKRVDDKTRKGNTNSSKSKTSVTFNNKLDKWFSEMPPEVTNKADRAIMEDIIREKMVAHQNEFRYRDKISKLKRQNTYLKSINQIQHQYLELRADTAPRPNRTNLNLGKTRHKTSLNMKHDIVEMCDKQVKNFHDTKTNKQNKTFETQFDEEMVMPDVDESVNPGLNGLKKIDLDQLAVDAYKSNPNRRFSFAYLQNSHHSKLLNELNEDSMRRKADKEHWLKLNQSKTHPSIVNISIEKGNNETTRASQLNQTLSVVKMDTIKDDTCHIQPELHISEDNNSSSSTASFKKRKGKRPSKTALSKFNTLEVFGGNKNGYVENGFSPDSTMNRNPLVKLDLRKTRPQIKPPKELFNSTNGGITKQPQEMATVDFRFGSGEVTITRKPNGDSFNSVEIDKLHSPNAPPNNSENSGRSVHSNVEEQNNDIDNTGMGVPQTDPKVTNENKEIHKVDENESRIPDDIVDNTAILPDENDQGETKNDIH